MADHGQPHRGPARPGQHQGRPEQTDGQPVQPDWAHLIPDAEWAVYRCVLEALQARGYPFAVGGGFAFSTYAGRWRDTKDIDLYILPRHRDELIALLGALEFKDYYELLPYDRAWIYRAYRETVIVDLIWASANQLIATDESWMGRGARIDVRGLHLHVVPIEELVWSKLYVLQRERCDWPDLLNVLHLQAGRMDWAHLLARVEPDTGLLGGLLRVFAWMCAGEAAQVPAWVWERVGLLPPPAGAPCAVDQRRVRLLDARDWFGRSQAGTPG